MATSIPKKELETVNRTHDNSFPQQEWKVKREGNDGGRMGKPCLSCAKSVDQAVIGYDESVETDDRFQMFSGVEGFDVDDDDEAEMFLDGDLEPMGDELEAFDSEYVLVDENAESFSPEGSPPPLARCPPPPPMQMTGCAECGSSTCACASRHMHRCSLASVVLVVAILALAAFVFGRKR